MSRGDELKTRNEFHCSKIHTSQEAISRSRQKAMPKGFIPPVYSKDMRLINCMGVLMCLFSGAFQHDSSRVSTKARYKGGGEGL